MEQSGEQKSHEHRVGKPRFDPVEKLRHRLYEVLTLLWMLSPATGSIEVLPSLDEGCNDFLFLWRQFLDNLSCLCDWNRAGKTVSAVAAERRQSSNHFWLASSNTKSFEHLQFMLSILRDVHSRTRSEAQDDVRLIVEASIELSRQKIKHYRRCLSDSVAKVRSTAEEGFEALLLKLDSLTISPDLDLCQAAVDFDHRALNTVIRRTTLVRKPSPWAPVRHYIARLQSWRKKAVQIVNFARQFPELLEDHTCELLPLPKHIGLPISDQKTNLASALGRMLPAHKQDLAKSIFQSLEDLRALDFGAAFIDNYNHDIALATHAEVYLLEHFYHNKLSFVENHRYTGCSKPSCYCCSLYMRYHPGNFVVRTSHGNAWIAWSPPLLSQKDKFIHTRAVTNDVIQHLCREVLLQIEERLTRVLRQPDSTSSLLSRSSEAIEE